MVGILVLLCGQKDLTLDLSSTRCSINFSLILVKESVLRQSYVYWENLITQSGTNLCHLQFSFLNLWIYGIWKLSFCFTSVPIIFNWSISLKSIHYRTEERAAGWYRLTREILKLPEAPSISSKESNTGSKDGLPPKATKDKSQKTRRPQPLIKLVMRRFKSISVFSLCSWQKHLCLWDYFYIWILKVGSALEFCQLQLKISYCNFCKLESSF